MKYTKFLLPFVLLLLFSVPAWAQLANTFDLTSFVLGSPTNSSGGSYNITATAGPLEHSQLNGGSYSLVGRFGIGSGISDQSSGSRVFLPLVRR